MWVFLCKSLLCEVISVAVLLLGRFFLFELVFVLWMLVLCSFLCILFVKFVVLMI